MLQLAVWCSCLPSPDISLLLDFAACFYSLSFHSLLACWVSCQSPSLYLGVRLTVFDETKTETIAAALRSQRSTPETSSCDRAKFCTVYSFGILIDTSSTFTSRSTFQKKSAGNRRFRGVGASGVAKIAVFACHHAPTSAAAGGLLCVLYAHARAQHARSTPVRGAFSCFCALRKVTKQNSRLRGCDRSAPTIISVKSASKTVTRTPRYGFKDPRNQKMNH